MFAAPDTRDLRAFVSYTERWRGPIMAATCWLHPAPDSHVFTVEERAQGGVCSQCRTHEKTSARLFLTPNDGRVITHH